jgi:diguanylate cyclase (GGDEF)-like protein
MGDRVDRAGVDGRRGGPGSTPGEPWSLTSAKIVMVDADESTADVVRAYLEEAGYRQFLSTTDSMGALALLLREQPDVVLLDLMMPEVSGFEILTAMRASPELRHLPVIVLTPSSSAEDKLKALERGATDFLAKPPDPSELVLRLRNTLIARAYQDRLAHSDLLTGLPNRRTFLERLERVLQRAQRDRTMCALLHVDIDRFKQVNEALGPRVGDELLRLIAGRLDQCVRATDAVARLQDGGPGSSISRLGGDEFAVLLPSLTHPESAGNVARRVVAVMREALEAQGHELFVTPSVGIALFPDDGADSDTLLRHAEVAGKQAKDLGGNGYEFYSSDIRTRSLERLTLENALRKALDRNELFLVYQPKVGVKSGRVEGAEVLLRWRHPHLGLVSPERFIPIAEAAGLIAPLGEWALQTACTQIRAWEDAGLGAIHVAVNVSVQQFRQRSLMRAVRDSLLASGLEPHQLVLELTESMLMENAGENVDALHELKGLGVSLSIDDFGTGYSSLSYLKRFPLDELKIDKAFMRGLPASHEESAIVTAVIGMAHGLGLRVVAEGVEKEDQLAFLRERGCDRYQGFLFSKPLMTEAFVALLAPRPEVAFG